MADGCPSPPKRSRTSQRQQEPTAQEQSESHSRLQNEQQNDPLQRGSRHHRDVIEALRNVITSAPSAPSDALSPNGQQPQQQSLAPPEADADSSPASSCQVMPQTEPASANPADVPNSAMAGACDNEDVSGPLTVVPDLASDEGKSPSAGVQDIQMVELTSNDAAPMESSMTNTSQFSDQLQTSGRRRPSPEADFNDQPDAEAALARIPTVVNAESSMSASDLSTSSFADTATTMSAAAVGDLSDGGKMLKKRRSQHSNWVAPPSLRLFFENGGRDYGEYLRTVQRPHLSSASGAVKEQYSVPPRPLPPSVRSTTARWSHSAMRPMPAPLPCDPKQNQQLSEQQQQQQQQQQHQHRVSKPSLIVPIASSTTQKDKPPPPDYDECIRNTGANAAINGDDKFRRKHGSQHSSIFASPAGGACHRSSAALAPRRGNFDDTRFEDFNDATAVPYETDYHLTSEGTITLVGRGREDDGPLLQLGRTTKSYAATSHTQRQSSTVQRYSYGGASVATDSPKRDDVIGSGASSGPLGSKGALGVSSSSNSHTGNGADGLTGRRYIQLLPAVNAPPGRVNHGYRSASLGTFANEQLPSRGPSSSEFRVPYGDSSGCFSEAFSSSSSNGSSESQTLPSNCRWRKAATTLPTVVESVNNIRKSSMMPNDDRNTYPVGGCLPTTVEHLLADDIPTVPAANFALAADEDVHGRTTMTTTTTSWRSGDVIDLSVKAPWNRRKVAVGDGAVDENENLSSTTYYCDSKVVAKTESEGLEVNGRTGPRATLQRPGRNELPFRELMPSASAGAALVNDDFLSWTVDDVARFVSLVPGCSEYVEVFMREKIDGICLPHVTEDHLLNVFKMRLGPTIRLRLVIESLTRDLGDGGAST